MLPDAMSAPFSPKRLTLEMEQLLSSMRDKTLEGIMGLSPQGFRVDDERKTLVGSHFRLQLKHGTDIYLWLRAEIVKHLLEVFALQVGPSCEVRRWPGGPVVEWAPIRQATIPNLPARIVEVKILTSHEPNEPEVDDGILLMFDEGSRLVFFAADWLPLEIVFSGVPEIIDDLIATRIPRELIC